MGMPALAIRKRSPRGVVGSVVGSGLGGAAWAGVRSEPEDVDHHAAVAGADDDLVRLEELIADGRARAEEVESVDVHVPVVELGVRPRRESIAGPRAGPRLAPRLRRRREQQREATEA